MYTDQTEKFYWNIPDRRFTALVFQVAEFNIKEITGAVMTYHNIPNKRRSIEYFTQVFLPQKKNVSQGYVNFYKKGVGTYVGRLYINPEKIFKNWQKQ